MGVTKTTILNHIEFANNPEKWNKVKIKFERGINRLQVTSDYVKKILLNDFKTFLPDKENRYKVSDGRFSSSFSIDNNFTEPKKDLCFWKIRYRTINIDVEIFAEYWNVSKKPILKNKKEIKEKFLLILSDANYFIGWLKSYIEETELFLKYLRGETKDFISPETIFDANFIKDEFTIEQDTKEYFAIKSSDKKKWIDTIKAVQSIIDEKELTQREAIKEIINSDTDRTIKHELTKGKNEKNLIVNIKRAMSR